MAQQPPSMLNVHVRLLGFSLRSITPSPGCSSVFKLNGKPISRVEVLGVVTSRDCKPNKFLRFTLDDATETITCILWLNHLSSHFFFDRQPGTLRVIADLAKRFADDLQIGEVARVRGNVGSYRGDLQVTVSDVVIESDPNAETLHWLDCISLARLCYFA
ncbi:FKBP-type peptidyl-prolyl cis-trans isomerase family protein isoform 1 [Hibiscus syriacus]|uniref:CST complex subunit STN1 n=1 Tax=Hibiscus syriacus TaxID=106335 RepID=A0A6A2X9Q4_HIBSY|nr:CST complex subunit STN1-like [Hibiscus syriacus]KAE8663995.1 FKBP-type peptidyl-prolyl cis-trans isomerase family protein isoform 1 [Hibiscus syriacus]